MSNKIFIDCDPGHDDLFAIMLAIHSDAEIIGISCVAGNQTVEKTTVNAIRALRLAGGKDALSIPVFRGASRPVLHKSAICPEIHGESGLGLLNNLTWAHIDAEIQEKIDEVENEKTPCLMNMYTTIKAHQNVKLIVTGPATNVGLLLAGFPDVIDHIEGVYFMGGAYSGRGNTKPTAEFNVEVDPIAWETVCRRCRMNNKKIYVASLELTHNYAAATDDIIERIRDKQTSKDDCDFWFFIESLMLFFAKTYKEVFCLDSPPVHDPCAVAMAICSEELNIKYKNWHLDVDCSETMMGGTTIVDHYGLTDMEPNATFAVSMDSQGYWNRMIECMEKSAQFW
ncbi:hypothetical protein PCE1_000283 [Barthelona sp. PCE]